MTTQRRPRSLAASRRAEPRPVASLHADAHAARRRCRSSEARAIYLYTEDGRRLLDGTSSWWVNIHGHSHPRLNAGLAHRRASSSTWCSPTARTGRRSNWPSVWWRVLPRGLTRGVLLRQRIDRGRSRDEDGLPVLEQPRPAARATFITLRHAYHGDTVGAMSASERVGVHAAVRADAVRRRPRARAVLLPLSARPERGTCAIECLAPRGAALSPDRVDDLGALLARSYGGATSRRCWSSRCCRAAGGMIVWPAEFLAGVRRLCDRARRADDRRRGADRLRPHRADVRLRACRASRPDIICLSKALTGGYMPLGATAGHRAGLRGVPQRRSHPDVLSRPLVHRQPAGLRRGDRQPRPDSRDRRGRRRSGSSKRWLRQRARAAARTADRRRRPGPRRRRHRRTGEPTRRRSRPAAISTTSVRG